MTARSIKLRPDTPVFAEIAGRATTTSSAQSDDAPKQLSPADLQSAENKGGCGFHPMFCFADATGEALAGLLRPGNAGPTRPPTT